MKFLNKYTPYLNWLVLYGIIIVVFGLGIDTGAMLPVILFLANAAINVGNAFRLYTEKNEDDLWRAIKITVFGLIPFYLLLFVFFMLLGSASEDPEAASTAIIISTTIGGFVLLSNAFYGFGYARLKNLGIVHLILPFAFVLNVFDAIYLLFRFHVKHN